MSIVVPGARSQNSVFQTDAKNSQDAPVHEKQEILVIFWENDLFGIIMLWKTICINTIIHALSDSLQEYFHFAKCYQHEHTDSLKSGDNFF